MINAIFLVGTVKKLTVTEPKKAGKDASAVILLQYGVQREATNGAVEFVNAAMIRIPSYKFPALRNKLKLGQKVSISGHIQGVFKNPVGDNGFFTVELVADRVDIESDAADEHTASSAAPAEQSAA